MSRVEDAIAFSHYLQSENSRELQQTRELLARSKKVIETSRLLLNARTRFRDD